jgi:flagellin
MIGVADGAASEVGSILSRLRELAVQSSSSTLASTERGYITDEQTQLTSEIDRIANTTEFDGTKLVDGASSSIAIQVGVRNTGNDRVSIILGNLTTSGLGLGSLSLGKASTAQTALNTLDTAINSVSSIRSKFGAVENRLGNALNNIESFSEANKTGESRIRDADFGVETANLSKNQILQQAGVAILSQAKNINQSALSLLQ